MPSIKEVQTDYAGNTTIEFDNDTSTKYHAGEVAVYQEGALKAGGLVIPGIGAISETVSSNFTLAASDDGKVFNVTTAITVTIPAGLSPRPNVAFIPPPTGNLSIAVSGGANINGATTTLTRARSANPAGIVVQPYTESDGYGVSGS